MAVSLVSTGVQFPDSTIQTTASIAAMTLVQTISPTSGTTVTITGLTATYKQYLIQILNLKTDSSSAFTDSTSLQLVMSQNGGSSYYSTRYSYGATVLSAGENVGTGSSGGQGNISSWPIDSKVSSRATSQLSGEVIVYSPGTTSTVPVVTWNIVSTWAPQPGYGASSTINAMGMGMNYAFGYNTANSLNALQFSWANGSNFTGGTFKVYGIS